MKQPVAALLAVAMMMPALALAEQSEGSWRVEVTTLTPPRSKEEAQTFVDQWMDALPKEGRDRNRDLAQKSVTQLTKGRTLTGEGLLWLKNGDSAISYVDSPWNSSARILKVEGFRRGEGFAGYGGHYLNVYARDPRPRFRLLGDQIALTQKPMGKLIKHWTDDQGRHWSEFADVRPKQTPNSAIVRWANSKRDRVVEADSILGDCAIRCFRFSKLEWIGDQPFRHMIHTKYFPDKRIASVMTLTNWRPAKATYETVLGSVTEGTRVTDARLSEDKPLVYEWTGRIPSLDELRNMELSGVAATSGTLRPSIPTSAIVASVGVVLVGVSAMIAIRRRTSAGSEAKAKL
jgi:hypothetical protein